MKAMKRLVVFVALAASALLFAGCEVWLFIDDGSGGGGGGTPGIGIDADIGVLGTNVESDKSLRALLYKKSGTTFNFEAEKVGQDGSETLQTIFEDLDDGTYKVVVYYDSDDDSQPDWGVETGYTSGEIYHVSGDYNSVVVDEAAQWDENNVQKP